MSQKGLDGADVGAGLEEMRWMNFQRARVTRLARKDLVPGEAAWAM